MPKVRVDAPTLLLLTFLLLFEDFTYTLTLVFCILLHEVGHIFASYVLGVKISIVSFNIFGARIKLASSLPSYMSEFTIAAAGPAANIIFVGVGMLFMKEQSGEGWLFFAFVNFALAFVNLLPISTLDGGRMISSVTSFIFGAEKSDMIMRAVSAVFIVLLWVISIFLWFCFERNISLFILCLYLFYSLIIKREF